MKQLYTFLLAVFLFTPITFAQTHFSTFEAPVRIADEIIPAINSAGDICLYTYRSGSAYFSTLHSSGQHIATAEHPIPFQTAPEIAGVLPLSDQFVFYRRENLSGVESLQPACVDRATGTVKVLTEIKPELDALSTFVQAFNIDEKLYALYFSKKTNNLQVCIFTDVRDYTVKKIPLNLPKMQKRLFHEGVPVFIDERVQNPIAIAKHQKKIYLRGEKLLLVTDAFGASQMDKKDLTTDILEIDLATQSARFTQLPIISKIRPIDLNSYLYQNTLFRFQMTTHSLNLSAYDLQTQQLVQEYAYKLHDPVTIKATPVIRNGGKNKFPDDTTTTETTDRVLRKMTEGNTFVLVDEMAPGILRLSLGAYQARPGNAAMLPTGAPLMSVFGPAAIPAALALDAIRMSAAYNPTEITTQFRSFLNVGNFDLAQSTPTPRLWDEADKYTKLLDEQKVALGGVAVYPYQEGQLHYVVLDREIKKFRIITLTQPQKGMSHSNQ